MSGSTPDRDSPDMAAVALGGWVEQERPPHGAAEPDPAALLAAAVLEHGPALLRVAARMLGDGQVGEDLVQEAVARALARPERFRGQSSPFSFLCGILLNLVRSELRRRRLRRWLSLDRVVEEAPRAEPASGLPGAEAAAIERERIAALRAAVERLPHHQRAAIVLVHLEGVSAKDAAAALGTSEAAVWQAVSRGRAALRRSLDGS